MDKIATLVSTVCYEIYFSKLKPVAVKDGKLTKFVLHMAELTDDERTIILKGCLINYYAS